MPNKNQTIGVRFGALAPPIYEQLDTDEELMAHYQMDADAVVRLAVRGMLSEAETHRARKRILKRVIREYREWERRQKP